MSGAIGPVHLRPLITSVRVEESYGHDIVHVWNRGGKAGELTVNTGDGDKVARRLIPSISRTTTRPGDGEAGSITYYAEGYGVAK